MGSEMCIRDRQQAPALRIPDHKLPFILTTDSSNLATGYALTQEFQEGERVVGYGSKRFNSSEILALSIPEKELYGILYGVTQNYYYLLGQKFTLRTDAKALTFLQKFKNLNTRIHKFALNLAGYDFDIVHQSKADDSIMSMVDYLSRSHEEQPMNKATYKDLKDQHLNEMKAPNLPAGPISKEDFEKYAEEYLRSFDKRHGPRHYDNPTQFTAYPEIPPRGSIFKKRLMNPFSQPEAPVRQSKINAVVEATEGAEDEIEHHLPDIPLTSAAMNSPEFGALQKEDPELRELARKAKTQDHETSGRFFFRDGVLMKKMPLSLIHI